MEAKRSGIPDSPLIWRLFTEPWKWFFAWGRGAQVAATVVGLALGLAGVALVFLPEDDSIPRAVGLPPSVSTLLPIHPRDEPSEELSAYVAEQTSFYLDGSVEESGTLLSQIYTTDNRGEQAPEVESIMVVFVADGLTEQGRNPILGSESNAVQQFGGTQCELVTSEGPKPSEDYLTVVTVDGDTDKEEWLSLIRCVEVRDGLLVDLLLSGPNEDWYFPDEGPFPNEMKAAIDGVFAYYGL